MGKKEIIKNRQIVQQRLVVWIVLTICFQIINILTSWFIIQLIAWLAVGYCVILVILYCYLEWQLLRL